MPAPPNQLVISTQTALSASNGGLFIAPGYVLHPERELASFELIFVRSGVLRLWERSHALAPHGESQNRFEISPGHTLILWPGRRHGPSTPYEPKTSFYWLHFEVDSAPAAAGAVVPQVANVPRPLRLVELFRRFLDDQENDDLEPNYAATLVKLMLLEIAQQDRAKHGKRGQLPARKLAATAQVAIGKRFREPITTSEIARTLHCNPDYLGRVYRETFGHSLTTGIHQARMHHAKNLLLLSSLNVKEISAACGYENPDYFRRMFRRFFDMQPNQFRSLHPRQHTNAA
ncbi:MAG: helix-turn-helix domain-containing protein [Chthoniobacterales bacterium]